LGLDDQGADLGNIANSESHRCHDCTVCDESGRDYGGRDDVRVLACRRIDEASRALDLGGRASPRRHRRLRNRKSRSHECSPSSKHSHPQYID
jgi:hypothetical protein